MIMSLDYNYNMVKDFCVGHYKEALLLYRDLCHSVFHYKNEKHKKCNKM